MENTIDEVNKKYERYTSLNQKFNEYMKKSYNIQKIFDLKEKQKLYDELWCEYGDLVEEYLDLDNVEIRLLDSSPNILAINIFLANPIINLLTPLPKSI